MVTRRQEKRKAARKSRLSALKDMGIEFTPLPATATEKKIVVEGTKAAKADSTKAVQKKKSVSMKKILVKKGTKKTAA